MAERSLLALLVGIVAVLLAQPSTMQQLDLYENEVCRAAQGGQGAWRCRRLKHCPSAMAGVGHQRPQICSFEGRDPIVCCPPKGSTLEGRPTPTPSRPPSSFKPKAARSEQMCRQYAAKYCAPRQTRTKPHKDQLELLLLGGTKAKSKEFPSMALIGFGPNKSIAWNCGGSLVSERYVLSAAHCTNPATGGPARWVRLGELDLDTTSDATRIQDFSIVARVNHPRYRSPSVYNDIALYQLDRPARFDDYVKPVCLHSEVDIPVKKATATGWGRTEFAGPTSSALLKVELTLVDHAPCNSSFAGVVSAKLARGVLAESMVCAGEKEGGKDTCLGDSGGPLMIAGTCLASQIGVTSFGRQCGLPDSPAIYTRVSHYVHWIEDIVWPTGNEVIAWQDV